MLQYVVIAEDGTDEQALSRRMEARPAHLEGARNLKANDQFLIGGAILDDQGTMRGSVMIVQFETEADLNEWLSREPYINGKVWQSIQVKRFKVADV
jgi:uncharacterized protein